MTDLERLLSKTLRSSQGCLEWTGAIGKGGYGNFWWKGTHFNAHRASWILQRGEIAEGLKVCHRCDNRLCIDVEHLFLGTQSENMADMVSKGRHGNCATHKPELLARGEGNAASKLTEVDILSIRNSFSGRRGELTDLARKYKVCISTVKKIVEKRTWTHV